MTYKDLLAHLDDTKGCAARVDAAIELAIAHDAHLTGVYIVTDPSPSSFVQGYLPADVVDMLQRQARERADAALARFAEVARRNQISFETASTACSTPRSPRPSPPMRATPTL
jgi:nucleotide-binding universal stress UspA family protein